MLHPSGLHMENDCSKKGNANRQGNVGPGAVCKVQQSSDQRTIPYGRSRAPISVRYRTGAAELR